MQLYQTEPGKDWPLLVIPEVLGRTVEQTRGVVRVQYVQEKPAVTVAVEDDEAVLVGCLFAQPRAAPEHLLEQDPRLDWPQEDQELEVRDVDPGRQEVDGHDDAGVGAVAELADALEGPVDPASDLGHERVALAEDVARLIDELIGVRGVGEVVGGEDQRLREPSVLGLMGVGVALDLLQDPAVGVRGGDVSLDGARVKRALVVEEVELLVAGLRVDLVDLLAFVEEYAVDADVRADLHHVVVDEVAVADRVLVCLLYTSPSPRDRTRYRMPSSACKKKTTKETFSIVIV